MKKQKPSHGPLVLLMIGLVIILTVVAVVGIWFTSWEKAEFAEIFGFHPNHEELNLQGVVGAELTHRCDTYIEARAKREDLTWPAWTFGADLDADAMEGILGEFNTETRRAEEAITEAELAFIHARTFAEDYDFEVQVPACNNLRRQRPMGIPR